jgi:hypothetical protein
MNNETLSLDDSVHQQPIKIKLAQESYCRLANLCIRRCCVIRIQYGRPLRQDPIVNVISQTWTVDDNFALFLVLPMM